MMALYQLADSRTIWKLFPSLVVGQRSLADVGVHDAAVVQLQRVFDRNDAAILNHGILLDLARCRVDGKRGDLPELSEPAVGLDGESACGSGAWVG